MSPFTVERPLADVEREIAELAAHINAATCRWLALVAEFDRRGGHEHSGFALCADWLAWRCSISPRTAREQVRVAQCLAELPATRAAFATGALSYSKVRALTRVADGLIEDELLELARHATAAQLDRIVRGYRGATAPSAQERAHARRHLNCSWDEDGSLILRASLPAEEGALFLCALERCKDALWADERGEDPGEEPAAGSSEHPAARGSAEPRSHERKRGHGPSSADAIVAMAETALGADIGPLPGGERYQVVLNVDADALGAQEAAPGSIAIADGPGLTAETARRLACDSALVALVNKDAKTLSVGRRTRSVPPSIVRALRSRDGGCRFPGCNRRRFVDAHHVRHWAHGGETSLENLVQLCRHHHRLVHEGGYTVERRGAELRFRSPRGDLLRPCAPMPAVSAAGLRRRNAAAGARIDERTCFPLSAGERFDLGLTVAVLAERAASRAGPGGGPAR